MFTISRPSIEFLDFRMIELLRNQAIFKEPDEAGIETWNNYWKYLRQFLLKLTLRSTKVVIIIDFVFYLML